MMMNSPGGSWALTKDFDIWDITPGVLRPEVLPPKNDDDPNSVIGGGELNLAAAVALYEYFNPYLTVFAYGNRSPYLLQRNYPSESEIMTHLFQGIIRERLGVNPRVDIFDEAARQVEGSGTFREVRNILELALTKNFDEVVLVTVLVHMTRVLGMVAKHLQTPGLGNLRGKIQPEVSECVLMRFEPAQYANRVWELVSSKSYITNLRREAAALEAMRSGVTQTTQLKSTPTSTK
jgi:hypothetical protein